MIAGEVDLELLKRARATGAYAREASVYIITDQGGLLVSHDEGRSFVQRTHAHGLGGNRIFALALAAAHVYVYTDGGLAVSHDKGTSFVTYPGPVATDRENVRALASAGGQLYLLSDSGLWISTDDGKTFARTSGQLPTNLYQQCDGALVAMAGHLVYVGRGGDQLLRSRDAGKSWQSVPLPNVGHTPALVVSGQAVLVGTAGGLFRFDPEPMQLTRVSDVGPIHGLASAGERLHVRTDKGLGLSTDGGKSFTFQARTADMVPRDFIPNETPRPAQLAAAGQTVYALLKDRLAASRDGGRTFHSKTLVDCFLPPPQTAGGVEVAKLQVAEILVRLESPQYQNTDTLTIRRDPASGKVVAEYSGLTVQGQGRSFRVSQPCTKELSPATDKQILAVLARYPRWYPEKISMQLTPIAIKLAAQTSQLGLVPTAPGAEQSQDYMDEMLVLVRELSTLAVSHDMTAYYRAEFD